MRIKFLPFERKHKCIAGYLKEPVDLHKNFDRTPGSKALIFFIRRKGKKSEYKIAIIKYDDLYKKRSLDEIIENIKRNFNSEFYQASNFNYQKEDIKLFHGNKFSLRVIKRGKIFYLDGFHRNTWYNSIELFNDFEISLFERYLKNKGY